MKIKIKKSVGSVRVNDHNSFAAPAPAPAPSAPTLSVAPPSSTTAPTAIDASKKPIKIKLKRKRNDPVPSSPALVRNANVAPLQFPLTHAPSELSSFSYPETKGKGASVSTLKPSSQPDQPAGVARPVKRIKLKLPPSTKLSPAINRVAIKKSLGGVARAPADRGSAPMTNMPPPSLPNRTSVPAIHSSPAAPPRLVPSLKTKIKIKKTAAPVSVPIVPVRDPVPVKARPPPRPRPALPDVLPKRRKPQDLPGPSPSKKIKVKTGIKPVQSGKPVLSSVPQTAAKPAPEAKAPAPPVEAVQLSEGTAFLEALTASVPDDQIVAEKALLTMVNKLLRKDRENLFRTEPQKTNLHSRVKNAYKAAIKQPIALATIRENIRGLDGKPRLRTWKQMECALDLMVANCVHFNGDDSHLSKTARGIRAEFTRLREKDAAAEAMAVVAPAEQATDFMPRLRSAMTETLPPRRAAAMAATLAREHTTTRRGGGRGGGARATRVAHLTMRMLDTGIRRVIEPNARFSYHKKEADFMTFGCTLGAWNLETGRSIWLARPRLAHAYPKRYVPFGSAALKQAFHLGSMCGRLADLIKSNAAKTVFLPRKFVPPPAQVAAQPSQQAGQQQAAHQPAQVQQQQQQSVHVQQNQAAHAQQRQAAQAQQHSAQPQQQVTRIQHPAVQQQSAQAQLQSVGQSQQQTVQQQQQQQAVRAQQQQQQTVHAQQAAHAQQQAMRAQQQQATLQQAAVQQQQAARTHQQQQHGGSVQQHLHSAHAQQQAVQQNQVGQAQQLSPQQRSAVQAHQAAQMQQQHHASQRTAQPQGGAVQLQGGQQVQQAAVVMPQGQQNQVGTSPGQYGSSQHQHPGTSHLQQQQIQQQQHMQQQPIAQQRPQQPQVQAQQAISQSSQQQQPVLSQQATQPQHVQ